MDVINERQTVHSNIQTDLNGRPFSTLEGGNLQLTIPRNPGDHRQSSLGRQQDVDSVVILKWLLCKFNYFMIKLLKTWMGPYENLEKKSVRGSQPI